MGKIIILGSGNAIPEVDHENTHFLIQGEDRTVLVDTGSNPMIQLSRAHVNPLLITDLILTHFHPDHVSGAPLLLMDLWLLKRKSPLQVYGLPHTLDRLETMLNLYDWKQWPGFFPVFFHRLPEHEMSTFLMTPEIKISSSPVQHLIPTIGLRIEWTRVKKSAAFSCDTQPCQAVIELARETDVLIHEATGLGEGHSSAIEAAQIARSAGAHKLYLIHYPKENGHPAGLVAEASKAFTGPVELARDLMEIDF